MSLAARLDRLPMSRPHRRLLVIGGLGYTFDGMDGAIVAFLLPALKDAFGISTAQQGLIGSAAPIGFFVGAIAAGVLGDRIGRRRVMMISLAVYAVASLAAAASPNYGILLAFRILCGVGAGAESAIVAPFLSEFVPAQRRGQFVGNLAGFFSFGFVAAAVIGRFVVPLPDGWRWAQVITAVPIAMLLWWRRSLPESPRYLAARGRTDEAAAVVSRMEAEVEQATGRPLPPVPADAVDDQSAPIRPGLLSGLRYLWSATMRRRTAVTWVIWFVITFSYYGFFTWIPSLLVGQGITVTKSFTFSIIIYLAQIPGYFSGAWVNEKLDRKFTIGIYLAGAAVAAFWLSQSSTGPSITVAGAVLSFFLNGTYAGVYAYTPEVFPTFIRATGSGLASAVGRIGSITAPLIIGATAASWGFGGVFALTTAVLAVGVVVTLALAVRTKGRSLETLTTRQADALEAAADTQRSTTR